MADVILSDQAGALSSIATQELAAYLGTDQSRARIAGLGVLLTPNTAQAIAVTLHEWRPMRPATRWNRHESIPGNSLGALLFPEWVVTQVQRASLFWPQQRAGLPLQIEDQLVRRAFASF
jgi:hypothetical protein